MVCHVKAINVFVRQVLRGFGRHIRVNVCNVHLDGPYTLIVAIITHRQQQRGVEPTQYVQTLAGI